ncbi:MAG: nucleotide exchange factor GrpE [Anaerovoracaceae bacterium]
MNKEANRKAAESFEDVEKDVAEEAKNKKKVSEKKNDPEGTEETQDNKEIIEEVVEEKNETSAEEEAINVKYLRLMADFQNYKRRSEKEKSDIYAYANEKIVTDLLDVIDNFDRALDHHSEDEGFVEGMNMIFKQFKGALEKAGLEEISALGEDFDPNFHNAVMTEDTDEYESGKVTEVLQKGYLLNKRVIRASMVKVNN